jgi:hypothetical protein
MTDEQEALLYLVALTLAENGHVSRTRATQLLDGVIMCAEYQNGERCQPVTRRRDGSLAYIDAIRAGRD